MKIEQELQEKINTRTKPVGSLGKLESLALKVGKIQNTLSPELKNPTVLVFAADHGIADEGVSHCPKEITPQMVMNFVHGGAAISVFCRQHDIALKVIDAGVDFDFPTDLGIIDAKIARGSENMLYKPAMTIANCKLAMERGAAFVRAEFENGCNVIGFGEMGIGNTSPASLLLHKFSGFSLEKCVGRGAGLDKAGVQHKYNILKQVSEKYHPTTPLEMLATFGGLEIAMMCGAVLEAYRLNMLILADGFIATSAFITAAEIEPKVLDNTIFTHSSNEPGHSLMLEYLKADPILHLELRLGEGTGVALAYPLLRSAMIFLNEMASFDSAAVTRVD